MGGVGGGASNGHLSVSRSSTPGLPRVSVVSEDQCLDRQGIIDITVNVHSFLAAISKLKKAMEDFDGGDVGDQDGEGEACVHMCVHACVYLCACVHVCVAVQCWQYKMQCLR